MKEKAERAKEKTQREAAEQHDGDVDQIEETNLWRYRNMREILSSFSCTLLTVMFVKNCFNQFSINSGID